MLIRKQVNILAMGQSPSFHPKTKEGIDKSWHNEAIETSFEPGSTMKIFTLAAAIEEKVLIRMKHSIWFL